MAATNPFDTTQLQSATVENPSQAGNGVATGVANAPATSTTTPDSSTTGTAGTNTAGTNVAPTGTAATVAAPATTGIIGAAMGNLTAQTTAGTQQQATSTGYAPSTATTTNQVVDPDSTVAGQLAKDIDSNSLLNQKAESDALQTANGRGLLNSSMAAGAGTSALLDKALQVATPDAATNADAAARNAAAANTTSQFNAGAGNTASQFTEGAANTTSLANAQSGNAAISQDAAAKLQADTSSLQARVQTATTAYNGALQTAMQNASEADKVTLDNTDNQVKTNLAQIQAQYNTQMQTSQSAATMYSQTMQSIGQIMQDPNLDAGAKQNLINQQMEALKNGLNIQFGISNIQGVSSLLSNLGGTTGPNSPPIPTTDNGGQSSPGQSGGNFSPGDGNSVNPNGPST